MTDSDPQHINVRTFHNDIKEILDGTRFMGRHYVVTNYGQAVAQVLPPSDMQSADDLTITDVRTRTREILQAVRWQNRIVLIARHGRAKAIICPLQ